ncbi:MAG: universal stress protein [Candidatus Eremiobacteraeota bacterium]|nr:universal stress protein [Candidatus Eremiobacteraeota bacterium]
MAAAFAHITVPVDGSTTAARGIAFALEFARGGCSVTFCSVVDPTLACLPVGYGVSTDPGPMLTVLDDDATLFCRAAQAKAAGAGVASDTQVLHGQCVQAIESLVRQNGSQAIVVGTHGRTGLARSLLGSVAEGLLRRSDVPVVVVHEGDVARAGPIAVALDESPAAHAALGTAIAIGAARGIPIALIHISGTAASVDPGRVDVLMSGAVKRAGAQGVNAEVVVRNGRAPETLLAAADELDCSMIVMGTHGRPFVERLLLGSVAAYVVQHARIPVVTVRRAFV